MWATDCVDHRAGIEVNERTDSMVRRFRYPIGIMALRGNGLLGDQHQEVLALFRTLDPTLRRYVMSHTVGRTKP